MPLPDITQALGDDDMHRSAQAIRHDRADGTGMNGDSYRLAKAEPARTAEILLKNQPARPVLVRRLAGFLLRR